MRTFNILLKNSEQLLKKAKELSSHPKEKILLQVFCGESKAEPIEQIRKQLIELFPGVAMIGASTAGEISAAQITTGETVVSVSVFESTLVTTYAVESQDLKVNGEAVGRAIHASRPKVAIAFCTGTTSGELNNSTLFIETINELKGESILAGGQAGTDRFNSDTYVFSEHLVTSSGAVVAMLEGPELRAKHYRNDGWTSIGKQMEVTRAVGNRVYSIDHKTIPEIYRYYLGLDFSLASHHPAIWPFPLVVERAGLSVKSVPIRENADGSFEFYRPLKEKESIRFSFCDMSALEQRANTVNQALRRHEPESVFVYSCSVRRQLFGDLIDIDTKALSDITTTSGFFTSTEYYTPQHGRAVCLIQNATFLTLSEKTPEPEIAAYTEPNLEPESQASKEPKSLLKVLTHLIATTSKELEASNNKLSQLARVDDMTGLFNRRYFDEVLVKEAKRHQRTSKPISLLLLDVDYFKKYNDHYGHLAGDDCLSQIGQAIQEVCKRPADVAFRYGGEEMGVILPETNLAGAKAVADSLCASIALQRIPHQGSAISPYVTVSVGYVCWQGGQEISISEKRLIKACDELLYQAKANGRNQAIGQLIGN